MKGLSTITLCAAALVADSAGAGQAIVDGLGGALLMQSRQIDGVFGSGSPEWTNAALRQVHNELHADGIETDRYVTFILAETDHGLTWMTLVDDKTEESNQRRGADRTQIGMTTTAPDTGIEFINDVGEDIQQSFDNGNRTQTASGHFTWNANGSGDAFAWAALERGDFVSFNFTRGGPDFPSHPGLRENRTFQFVTWNGETWEVLTRTSFSRRDQFAFTFTVIPLPAPVLIGLSGLGLAAIARRRMMRRSQ